MIHIFFVPGMHGSMLEHVLDAYTLERSGDRHPIQSDGSMHGFGKAAHAVDPGELARLDDDVITTPIYPTVDADFAALVHQYSALPTWESDRKILVHAPDLRWCEINMLFQYHKIARGTVNRGLDIFFGPAQTNITQWNPNYQTHADMRPWELREWISLFYADWVQPWMLSAQQVQSDWLVIANRDIVELTLSTVNRIMTFCGLTPRLDLADFLEDYRKQQSYVIREHVAAHNFVDFALRNRQLELEQPLSVVAEAMIQQHLRQCGWEIECDGLDTLPLDTLQLRTLMYRPTTNLHAIP